MLNVVHLEGVVVSNSEFRGTRFLRVASAYDPGRQRNSADAAYVTLRVEPPLAAVASVLQTGATVRVTGYIISRDYGITLSRFAEVAESDDDDALSRLRALARSVGDKIAKPHATTEVVVEQLVVLQR